MSLFQQLSIIVAAATAIALVMRLLRQPLIIGHIITGLLVGPLLFDAQSIETFTLFSEIGIAILLFTVGLNLTPSSIREFGKVSTIAGIGQVIITSFVGYVIIRLLGFPPLGSLYMAIALAFSSTIIILKLIADKGDLETLYAKISIGFLLVQDLIAVLLLFAIPLLSTETASWTEASFLFLLGLLLVASILVFSLTFMPKLNRFLSHSVELLFLFAIAWGVGIASLFGMFGFPLETGALVAGVGMSTLPSRREISARLSPLRDFFIILFFILLGSQLSISGFRELIVPGLILSLLVLIGNPLILMAIMGFLGYRKRTSLQTGLTVAQISEFSLILVALGVSFGQVSRNSLSLVTLVGIITIFGSTYLILYSDKIYSVLRRYLSVFERAGIYEKTIPAKQYPFILFGCNRIGLDFLEAFKKLGEDFLVVEYNPEIMDDIKKQGIDIQYGDARDYDFLESLDFSGAEFVVSTVPDSDTNLLITRSVKQKRPHAILMTVAHRIQDAMKLYAEGADYVILPHFLGGKYAAELVIKMRSNPDTVSHLKEEQLRSLRYRLDVGHEHPQISMRY